MNYELTNLPHNISQHHIAVEEKKLLDTTRTGIYQNDIETSATTETRKDIERRGNKILDMKHEIPLKYQLLQEFLGKPPRPARKSQHMEQQVKTMATQTDCAL